MDAERLKRLFYLSTVTTHSRGSVKELNDLAREAAFHLTGIGCIACQNNADCITDFCGRCNDEFSEFELVQDLEQRIERSELS